MEYAALENKDWFRARYRVSQLRSYYTHLLVYIAVNLLITLVKVAFALRAGDTFGEATFNADTLSVWLIWGAFLLIHTIRVFALPVILGYDWEYRKLESYMEEELKENAINYKNHG